ncbi:MAG: 3-hydroxyacyl-CoA dehydrogenase NAD-binding domain-containing protein [Stackebrandtia sp.]
MINTAGVVGLGTMGAGIAEVFAKAGLTVIGVEVDEAALARGEANLAKSLDRQVAKGRLSEDAAARLRERTTLTVDFDALSEASLVVEAVPERMEIKHDLFARLDAACADAAILATNTSSLSVTEIADGTSRPGRVCGMHFFNPAPIMKLVEVVRADRTDADVIAAVEELATRAGKTPVVIGDRPGFIANRLLLGYLNQAAKLRQDKRFDRDSIDAAIRGAGFPMGPLMLLDVIGLDTSVAILDTIYEHGGRSPRHEAAQVLRDLVAEGKLGKKAGHGFYDHGQSAPRPELDEALAAEIVAELLPPHVGEAQAMADSGYASPEAIDTAMTLGCGYPRGPFSLLG